MVRSGRSGRIAKVSLGQLLRSHDQPEIIKAEVPIASISEAKVPINCDLDLAPACKYNNAHVAS